MDHSSSGEPQQVLQFYDQLREPIYRYLLCLRLTPETAEDLVHETFLRLHRNLREKKIKTDTVRAWAFRVAHNLAISLKRRSNEIQVDRDDLVFLADAHYADEHQDPEEAVLNEEWLMRVRKAVRELPEQQQRCIHLRAEGLRYREIADVLGMPIPTVAVHLQRAMERLMEECGE